jgi:twinkle protein
MSLFYHLNDFKGEGGQTPLRSVGKNWQGICPQCGSSRVFINKSTLLFNCFHCGQVHGRIRPDGAATPPPPSLSAGRTAAATGVSPTTTVTMIPEDYRAVSEELLTQSVPFGMGDADALPEAIRNWLTRVGHRVETLADMRVRWQGNRVIYVNYVNGRPVNMKYRDVCEKKFTQESPVTPCAPYNIDCINPLLVEDTHVDRLIITEGEKDAVTLRQAGFHHVVSIANGAKTDVSKSFEAFEGWMQQARNIVVCGDSDRPGRELVQALSEHFGARTLVCTLPSGCKDISDVLVQHGEEAVREVIARAERVGTGNIVRTADLRNDVLRRAHGLYDHGYDVGMGPLTDSVLHLTDNGGLIIVTGEPNAGKTDFLDNLCAHLIWKCHRNVAVCSFEMPDKTAHTERYLRLATGAADLSPCSDDDLIPFLHVLE